MPLGAVGPTGQRLKCLKLKKQTTESKDMECWSEGVMEY